MRKVLTGFGGRLGLIAAAAQTDVLCEWGRIRLKSSRSSWGISSAWMYLTCGSQREASLRSRNPEATDGSLVTRSRSPSRIIYDQHYEMIRFQMCKGFEYSWVVSKLLTYRQRYLCFKFTTQALISMTEHDNQHTNWHKPFHHTSLVRNTLDHSFHCWDPTTCTTQMRFNSANINGQTSKRSINIVSLMRRFI